MTPVQQRNAELLKQLFDRSGLTIEGSWSYRKLLSEGYMDLSIDRLGTGPDKGIHFSLAHNGECNGDVMADPDMEIVYHAEPQPHVLAMHYQNDWVGVFQTVHQGNTTQAALDDFLRSWLTNLLEQGHQLAPKE